MSVHLSGTVDGGLPAIFGDPERLEQFAGRLDALAEEVQGLGSDACEATTGIAVRANWSGNAAEAYLNYCRSKSAAVTSLSGPLHEIAAAVRGYAAVLEAQQRRVHSAVHSVEGITDHTIESHRVSQAEWHVIEATDATDNAVYQATNRVEAAKGELDRIARELEVSEASRDLGEFVKEERDALLGFVERTASDMADGIEFLRRAALSELLDAERLYKDGKISLKELRAARLAFATQLEKLDRLPHPLNLRDLRAVAGSLKFVDRFTSAINIPQNIATLISPGESGWWGLGDRAAAGASLIAALNVFDVIPGPDAIPITIDAAVGVYYGAKYVAQHWHTVSHVLDAVGHAEVNVMKSEAHLATGAAHWVTSSVKNLMRL